jgi:hypothetical protein
MHFLTSSSSVVQDAAVKGLWSVLAELIAQQATLLDIKSCEILLYAVSGGRRTFIES